jgi:hypothetical protein
VKITVNPGETANQAWLRHEIAALSEGCCPKCGGRMQPTETDNGPGARCSKGHGLWWHGETPGAWEGDYTVKWWAEFNPYTGARLR